MSKVAVPPCKAPTDRGKHIVLNFPVANIKEQSVILTLKGAEGEVGSQRSTSISVAFDTFSPSKHFEKVVSLPAAVVLAGVNKSFNSKNMTLTLPKAEFASSPSLDASSPPKQPKKSPPADPIASDGLLPPAEESPILPSSMDASPTQHDGEASDSDDSPDAASNQAPKLIPVLSDTELDISALADDTDAAATSSKDKKKRKPKKKARSGSEVEGGPTENTDEAEVKREQAKYDEMVLQLQAARSQAQPISKEARAAQERLDKALSKVRHLEKELQHWRSEVEVATGKNDASKSKLTDAEQAVSTLEEHVDKQRSAVETAKQTARQRELDEAESERIRQEEEERRAQEERQSLQEERRRRAEEERQKAAEEKKRKEAERKENAKRREQERKEREAEEERQRAERRRKPGAPPPEVPPGSDPSKAASAAMAALAELSKKHGEGGGALPVFVDEAQKKRIAKATALFNKDRPTAVQQFEEAAKGRRGEAALLALSKCYLDAGDSSNSGVCMLRALDHGDCDDDFTESDRSTMATQAMAQLKDDARVLLDHMPIIDRLAPKYPILHMAASVLRGTPMDGPAPAKTKAPVKPPGRPLIEEVSTVEHSRSPAAARPPAPAAAVATPPADDRWAKESEGDGVAWVLELPVPSIDSLAEVNLDINPAAVRLTPVGGGPPVAEAAVPQSANSDEASAKWSKKRKVLTIRMPLV